MHELVVDGPADLLHIHDMVQGDVFHLRVAALTWAAVRQGRSHSKNFVRGQIFLLKRATVFGSGRHVSKHKTTTYARMLGWKRPLCPSPGFANAVSDVRENTALVICVWRKHRQIALFQRSWFGCDALCHQMFWMRVYHSCGTTIPSVFRTAHFLSYLNSVRSNLNRTWLLTYCTLPKRFVFILVFRQ